MTQIDDEEMERIARQVRSSLGMDDQLRPDMITVIFKLKTRGVIKNYERVPDHEMPHDEARFDADTGLLYIRESTFRAANTQYSFNPMERKRARFTIAHELGHIVLGHVGTNFRGATSARGKQLGRKIRINERDAERFAAAFLAPEHLA